jgi:hypothetical protein
LQESETRICEERQRFAVVRRRKPVESFELYTPTGWRDIDQHWPTVTSLSPMVAHDGGGKRRRKKKKKKKKMMAGAQ